MQRNGTSRSARRSLFSRFVLAGVFSAATAGWFGVQLTPADGIQAAAIGTRRTAGAAHPAGRCRGAAAGRAQPRRLAAVADSVTEGRAGPGASPRPADLPSASAAGPGRAAAG